MYETKLKPFILLPDMGEFESVPRSDSGRNITQKSVTNEKLSDLITATEIASNAITQAKMADDSIGQAELKTNIVSVTVSAGSAAGTATVTSGAIIIGWRATGNQDQFIDNIAVSGTTLTITLAANATADNTFQVTLLES